jgi:hypothetical protein
MGKGNMSMGMAGMGWVNMRTGEGEHGCGVDVGGVRMGMRFRNWDEVQELG